VGNQQREKSWRLDSLTIHISRQHLRRLNTPFLCPWDGCSDVLATPERFVSHTSRVHGIKFPSSVIPARNCS
jgi:hypothetical protein